VAVWMRSCAHADAVNGRAALSVVQPLLALIGVAIGAFGSYLVGSATERVRWRREQSSRWDDRRAQAYAEYGYAVKNVYIQCLRLARLRAEETHVGQAAAPEALSQLGALTAERTAKWELVLLLGDPETIAAARAWHRRIWQVELLARGDITGVGLEELVAAVNADRACFYTAARHDLGITSGDIPVSGPWEPPESDSRQPAEAT
jgi:hypothetical protein